MIPHLAKEKRTRYNKTMKKIAPSYVKDFQCMGAECPDTCCHGWTIPVSHHDVQRLNRVNNTLIPIIMEPMSVNPDTSYFAGALKRHHDGACSQLKEGWCTLQKKYHHGVLPSTCQDFPRVDYLSNVYHERYLSFACPKSVELLLSEPMSMEDIDFQGLNEIRQRQYGSKDMDDHMYFWSCISQSLNGIDLWIVLHLWIEDFSKNIEATYQWSDTLLEHGVPDIKVETWFDGQHALALQLFQRYLKKERTPFQLELLSYLPEDYIKEHTSQHYEHARQTYGQTEAEYETMRRWLFSEGLRQGMLTSDGSSVVKNLAYQWNFIRWLAMGLSVSKGDNLELEEWGNAIYMYSRLFQHNGNFQRFLHDLESDVTWGQNHNVIALVS